MNTRSLALAALTAGLMVGGSAALGSTALAGTSGEGGTLSGNQVVAPISLPINLSGNAVAVLGEATASAQGQTVIEQPEPPEHSTSGKNGVLSGNQVFAPLVAPITACGNAVAVLGDAAAGCQGKVKESHHHGSGPSTGGADGVLSGNQVYAPVDVPITACGNAVALLGQAEAGCQVLVESGGGGPGDDHHGDDHHDGDHHGGGHHGGGHHKGGSGGGHHGGGSGGSGSHETGVHAAAPAAPHSPGNAHQKGGLPLTGGSTGLLAGLGAAVLAVGAILMTVGRRRRSGAVEGGTSTN
jgi:hypothetical protein